MSIVGICCQTACRMDEGATWYGSIPRSTQATYSIRQGPSSRRKGHNSPLFLAHVYCDNGRPSRLLLRSCTNGLPKRDNRSIPEYKQKFDFAYSITKIVPSLYQYRFLHFSCNKPWFSSFIVAYMPGCPDSWAFRYILLCAFSLAGAEFVR